MISIRTNTDSINAQQNLNVNHTFQSKTIQQLTSGYRINSSADDAAGLAIANSYRSKVAELNQGVSNANDGVSQLQIVDGGLSNISTILDRMKTLATQSASATFTGNRSVLNQEYTGLLSEINRQATNVNLNAGGSFNTALSVYIGGASDAANATIGIDLSGASNAVDSTSLGLASTSVAGGGTGISGNTLNLNTPGATFVKGTSPAADQTFTFNLVDSTGTAKTVQATVKATANGSSLSDVLTSLNQQLSSYGITAGTDANGAIQFGGSTAFTVSDNATVAPPASSTVNTVSTGSNLLTNQSTAAGNGVAENISNYLVDGKSVYVPPSAGGSETLKFTSSSGAIINVNLTNATTGASAGDTLAHAINSINAATSSYGIYAVANAAGTGISFQSTSSFSVNSAKSAGSVSSTSPAAGATATFTGNTTSLSNSPTSLANGSQTFTFNVAKSDGSSSSVNVTLAGGTSGLTASQVITGLNAAIAAKAASNPELGTITAALDSNNKLVFTGGASNTAFSVNVAAASAVPGSPAGTTTFGVVNGTGTAENTTNHTADFAYSTNVGATQSLILNDGTGTTGQVALSIAANSTVQSAIKQINTQLAANSPASTTVAVLSSDGTSISFQNASHNLTVGATSGSGAIAAAAATSNPSLTGNSVDMTSGTKLATGNQVLTFHTLTATGADDTATVTVLGGGGLANQTAILAAVNAAIGVAVAAGHTGLTGITAVSGTGNTLSFTGTGNFTVKASAPTAGTDNIVTTNATGSNTNLHVSADQTYAAGALSYTVNDGTPTKVSVTSAQNTSVSATVTEVNRQLIAANSSVRAVVASDGINISFQSANNFTLGGVASNASIASPASFGATNTSSLQSGPFLAGGSQTFTFNVAKADGTISSVGVTLNGGANGINSGDVVTKLNAALAAQAATKPELGTITAALDSNNQLVFTGGASNTAFTVSSAAAVATTAGATPVSIAGVGTAENTSDHVADSTYNLSSTTQSILLKDGTGASGEVSLNIAANSNIASAISQINTQLQAANSATTAVLSADGTAISFQNASNVLSVGGTKANAISNPALSTSGTASDLSQSGALLKGGATQVFHFHIANSTTGAAITADITLTGTSGGLTGPAAVAQLNAALQTASQTAGQSDLANIVAGVDGSNHLYFTNASGTNPAYTVKVDAASSGTGVVSASNVENTNNRTKDVAFAANTAITSTIVDANSTSVTLNLNNSTDTVDLATAIGKINAQLAAGNSLVRAVADGPGTGITYQAAGAFTVAAANSSATSAATFGANSQNLSLTGDYLQGSTQDFTFNVKGANGANDAVTLTLHGNTGLTGAGVVTALQSLIDGAKAAHPGLANIIVGQDATTHKLTFTTANGSTSPFTVSVAAAVGSGTGVYTAAATGANTNLHTYTQTYSAGALNLVVNDGSATKLSLTSAQNTSVSAAVAALNQQLSAAGSSISAVIAANGSDISFQSSNDFRVGGTASNPTTTKPASFGTANTVQIQSGPFLANNATQAITFNVVDPTSKSSTAYTINVTGGANGLQSQSAVLSAINSALATAVAGTPASGNVAAVPPAPGLAGITASVDANGHLSFSGTPGQAFTVNVGTASAGTGLTSNSTAVSSDNSALYAVDQTFTSPTTAKTQVFTVGSQTASVTISANATIDQQITQTNTQLLNAGITNLQAVKSGDGTSISYQGSAAFSIGTPGASGVFDGSTSAGTTVNAAVVPTASQSGLTNAEGAINAINAAIKALGLVQGSIGAGENKLQYAINLAQSQISNFSSAESQIRDTDVAQQAANLTKSQVLTQTSIAAMAQANSEPQSVLKLLQ